MIKQVTNVDEFKSRLIDEMTSILHLDREMNQSMGNYGALHILDDELAKKSIDGKVKILTHCNTGSLATGGYGTALGKSILYKVTIKITLKFYFQKA